MLSLRTSVRRHERALSALAFLVGFVLDALTLPGAERLASHVVIFSYLGIAAGGIALGRLIARGRITRGWLRRIDTFVPLLVHFAFGGLWSMLFVLYFRGATLAGSWVFLLFLGGIFFATELLHGQYRRFVFQVVALFATLFLFFVFYIPLLLEQMGVGTFLFSGVAAFVAIMLLVELLFLADRGGPRERRPIILGLLGVLFLMNALYFTGTIPPIPLALNHIGLYHTITREEPGYLYRGTFEPTARWYDHFLGIARVYHKMPGEPVNVGAVIFAPGKLTTPIRHEWKRYDPDNKSWATESVVRFSVSGGRAEGFRGWSTKEATTPGRWRVDIRTERGQLIGRIDFLITDVTTPALQETKDL